MKKKQYIEKAKILNELKSCLKYVQDPFEHNIHTNRLEEVYEDLIDFINGLKVKTIEITKDNNSLKEADLDKSARHYLLHEHISPLNEVLHQADLKVEMQYHKDIESAYKAGFELGLKAQKGE